MKKEDFYNTKWNASAWTEDMKTQWQTKCFELGFSWHGKTEVFGLSSNFFWMDGNNYLYLDANDYEYFLEEGSVEKHYKDMFPDQPEDKLDVVAEIVKLVHEAQGIEDVEEEDTFEGLVYVAPEGDYLLRLETLSQDQKVFLSDNLVWGNIERPTEDSGSCIHYSSQCKNWVVTDDFPCSKTSFNNIFQHKEV